MHEFQHTKLLEQFYFKRENKTFFNGHFAVRNSRMVKKNSTSLKSKLRSETFKTKETQAWLVVVAFFGCPSSSLALQLGAILYHMIRSYGTK